MAKTLYITWYCGFLWLLIGCTSIIQPKKQDSNPDTQKPTLIPEVNAVPIISSPIHIKEKEDPNSTTKTEPVIPEPTPEASWNPLYSQSEAILSEFVDDRGLVNYAGLRRKRVQLKDVLRLYAHLDPNEYGQWPPSHQAAFWINAYNLHALKTVTDQYPFRGSHWMNLYYGADSLRHIRGFKTQYKFILMDEEFTLSTIENRILKRKFRNPNLFFALAQQTYTSPPLANRAYRGNTLEKQLKRQIKIFVQRPDSFRIDRVKNDVWLSPVFSLLAPTLIDSYGIDRKYKDHPPGERAILNFISDYISEDDKVYLETANYRIRYRKYNWRLNDASR